MELLLPLAVIAYLLINKKKTDATKFIQTVQAAVTMIKFDLSKTLAALGATLYFKINLRLRNTTDFSTTLNSGYMDVYFKGKSLGRVNITQPSAINAKGDTTLPVAIAIPSTKIFESIKDALNAVKVGGSLTLQFKGEFQFPLGTYQLNEEKTFQLI